MDGFSLAQDGASSTPGSDLWLWDDMFQNDSLPFFDLETTAPWNYQNNFHVLDAGDAKTDGGPQVLSETATAHKPQPDMNDPKVLELFMKIAFFQKDIFSEDLIFQKPDHSLQYLIHSLARKLDLEYEHSVALRQVRISRTPPVTSKVDLYPISNDSTLNNLHDSDLSGFGDEFVNLASDAHLDLGLSIMSTLPNRHLMQLQNSNSEFEGETMAPSQTYENGSNFSASLPDVSSHASSTKEQSVPIPEKIRSIQSSSVESLLSQKFPTPSSNYGMSESRKTKPTSTPQEFVFVSGTINSKKIPKMPHEAQKASVAACWRCKFVRKKCEGNNNGICDRCHKGEKDIAWQLVGCKRGQLDSYVSSIVLCLKQDPNCGIRKPTLSENDSTGKSEGLSSIISDISAELDRPIISLHGSSTLLNRSTLLGAAIQISEGSPEQARLIELSLQCFRSWLKAASKKVLSMSAHQTCTLSACTVDSSNTVSRNLNKYVNELSRIMFQKKNLRGDKAWCLPTFYSLCIQGLARRFLLSLPNDAMIEATRQSLHQHLHLAVHLFSTLARGVEFKEQISDWVIQDEQGIENGIKFRTQSGFLEQLFSIDSLFIIPDNSASKLVEKLRDDQGASVGESESSIRVSGDCSLHILEEPPCGDLFLVANNHMEVDMPEQPQISAGSPMQLASPERTDETVANIDSLNNTPEGANQKENEDHAVEGDLSRGNDYGSSLDDYKHLSSAFDELVKSLKSLKLHWSSKPAREQNKEPASRGRSSSLKRKTRTPSIYSRAGSQVGSRISSRAGSRVPSGISSPAMERPPSPFPDFFKDLPKTQDLWTQSKEADVFDDEFEGREVKKRWSWQR